MKTQACQGDGIILGVGVFKKHFKTDDGDNQ